LKNEHYKLTCASHPVVVRRIGTMVDYEKEVKLHKSVRKTEKDKQSEFKEKLKTAEEIASSGASSSGSSSATSGDHFAPGTKVMLDGLTNSPRLNGAVGTIVKYDEKIGNYIVNVENSDETLLADMPSIMTSLLDDNGASNSKKVTTSGNKGVGNGAASGGTNAEEEEEGDEDEDGPLSASDQDNNNSSSSKSSKKKEKLKRDQLEADRVANRGKYVIELKYPWMHKSVYNVPILVMVSSNDAMKRLPWMG
jgi:hypothetical protein